jgi:hypothetical protein
VTVRVVHAEGNAAERGLTIGRELGDLIHASVDFYRGYFDHLGVANVAAALVPYRAAAVRALPELSSSSRRSHAGPRCPSATSSR